MRIHLNLSFLAALALGACGDNSGGTTEGGSSSGSGSSTTDQPTTGSTGAPSCEPGEILCLEGGASVCDDAGKPGPATPCASGTCAPGVGCPVCAPGETQCMGAELQQCNADGSAWEVLEACNAAQGLTCDPGTKTCTGVCLPEELAKDGLTTTGCEFYALTLTQPFTSIADKFAVVIENPGDEDANVTITQTDKFTPIMDIVPAQSIKVVELPFAEDLTGTIKGELLYDGAYRIQSDRPVRAVQYNTFNVSASADSTTLWPSHTWGSRYYVASFDTTMIDANSFYRGAWALVGGAESLEIAVTARPGTVSKAGPGIGLDGSGLAKLGTGDALQILAGDTSDLTGTFLDSNGPIQAFGGHSCAFVPADAGYCDHIEDAMLPIEQLGDEYVLVPPVRNNSPNTRRPQVVRVIATAGPTTLTYDPPQAMAPTMIPDAGEFIELPPSPEVYLLTADQPILVVQYMVGATVVMDKTDPAMVTSLPTARWSTVNYVHTLPDWLPLDVDIAAPTGATVAVGGNVVMGWTPVGGSGYSVAHVRLDSDVGLAEVFSDMPVSVSVYATRAETPATSYWHIGGGELAP